MAYGSRGFLPFLFEGFQRKNCCLIVIDLLLFGWLCCWLNCLLNLFLAHKEGNVILEQLHLVVFPNMNMMHPNIVEELVH